MELLARLQHPLPFLTGVYGIALSLASGRLITAYACIALILAVVKGLFPGMLGASARWLIYCGIGYFLWHRVEFQDHYGHAPEGMVAAAIVTVVLMVIPIGVTGGLLRRLLGGGHDEVVVTGAAAAAAAAKAQADDPRAAGRGIYAANYGKEEKREVATIMMTDMQGYSKKMEQDETGTWELLKQHNAIMRKHIAAHRGKEIKTIGDAFMVLFRSPLDAVNCALACQREFATFNKSRQLHDQMRIRIGIHMDEVILTKNDAFGEGVNIAARLEPQAVPGGAAMSKAVYDEVKGKVSASMYSIGVKPLKNIKNPPEIFMVTLAADQADKVVQM